MVRYNLGSAVRNDQCLCASDSAGSSEQCAYSRRPAQASGLEQNTACTTAGEILTKKYAGMIRSKHRRISLRFGIRQPEGSWLRQCQMPVVRLGLGFIRPPFHDAFMHHPMHVHVLLFSLHTGINNSE